MNPDISQQQLDQEAALLSNKIAQEAANDGLSSVLNDSSTQIAFMIEQLIAPLFSALAPNWHIKEHEVKALAASYAPVVIKYFPDAEAGNIPPEFMAALVTIGVFGSRRGVSRLPPEPVPVKEDAPCQTA